jgi:hypothetical protein
MNVVLSMTSDAFTRGLSTAGAGLGKFESESRSVEARLIRGTAGYQAMQLASWQTYFDKLKTKHQGNAEMLLAIDKQYAATAARYYEGRGVPGFGANSAAGEDGDGGGNGRISVRSMGRAGTRLAGIASLAGVEGPVGKVTGAMMGLAATGEMAVSMFGKVGWAGAAAGGLAIAGIAVAAMGISAYIDVVKSLDDEIKRVQQDSVHMAETLAKGSRPQRDENSQSQAMRQAAKEERENLQKIEEMRGSGGYGSFWKSGHTTDEINQMADQSKRLIAADDARAKELEKQDGTLKVANAERDLAVAKDGSLTEEARRRLELQNKIQEHVDRAHQFGTKSDEEAARLEGERETLELERDITKEQNRQTEQINHQAAEEAKRAEQEKARITEHIQKSMEAVKAQNASITGNEPLARGYRIQGMMDTGYTEDQARAQEGWEHWNQQLREAKTIHEQMLSPLDKYAEKLREIDELWSSGAFVQHPEDAGKAAKAARDAAEKALASEDNVGNLVGEARVSASNESMAGISAEDLNPHLQKLTAIQQKLTQIEANTRQGGGFTNDN